jgi:hypothetical protein
MDTVVDQVEVLRQQRYDVARRKYSEIVLRFDAPRPGDAEVLDRVMCELKIDLHELECDVHRVQQYRQYVAAKNRCETEPSRDDADCIRRANKRLFMAMEAGQGEGKTMGREKTVKAGN